MTSVKAEGGQGWGNDIEWLYRISAVHFSGNMPVGHVPISKMKALLLIAIGRWNDRNTADCKRK